MVDHMVELRAQKTMVQTWYFCGKEGVPRGTFQVYSFKRVQILARKYFTLNISTIFHLQGPPKYPPVTKLKSTIRVLVSSRNE